MSKGADPAVTATQAGAGWSVARGDGPLTTPAGRAVILPTRALAAAVAAEWGRAGAGAGRTPNPAAAPLTRLVNVALDRTPLRRAEMIAAVAGYAGTDLLAYRADSPADMAARQAAAWGPLAAWGRAELGLALAEVVGVVAAAQDPAGEARLTVRAGDLDDCALTALTHGVGLTGSAVLGFALLLGRIDADAAWTACQLDELYSLERWGEDGELRARVMAKRQDLLDLEQFCRLL